MGMRIGVERPAQPRAHPVEALTRQRQDLAPPRQAAGEREQHRPLPLDQAPEAAHDAQAEARHLDMQIGADRHGALGGGGRRRRAEIGDEVDDGPVGLVPDR